MKAHHFLIISIFIFSISVVDAKPIEIEGELVNSYCTEYFGLASVRFINTTDEWIILNDLAVDFGQPEVNNKVRIVSGIALSQWYESIGKKVSEDRAKLSFALGAVGFVIGKTLHKNNFADKSLMLGALGALTINEVNKNRAGLDVKNDFPKEHLLYGDIIVPPGLYTERWILFNTKNDKTLPYITNVNIKAVTNTGAKLEKNIELRIQPSVGMGPGDIEPSASGWQSNLINKPKNPNAYSP